MNLEQLRLALREIEEPARRLPWAAERPWRAETHTWVEGALVVVDLHDLSVRLALRVVGCLDDDRLDAVCLITGRGKHMGGHSRLRRAVGEALVLLAERRGWATWSGSPGRIMIAVDPSEMPSEPTSWMLVLVGALVVVGVLALSPVAGCILLAGIAGWAVWRRVG